ncbi:MAG TPA: hypothetical protein PKC67_02445 [Kiritimatiellia bacterium]|nr:hypothetical protein [Kiritimatiellia bacterium]HMP33185.1 hypothetical protein [Kiritimatiellia bacterium]
MSRKTDTIELLRGMFTEAITHVKRMPDEVVDAIADYELKAEADDDSIKAKLLITFSDAKSGEHTDTDKDLTAENAESAEGAG